MIVVLATGIDGELGWAPQDGRSAIRPISPCRLARADVHHLARIYRRRYGLRVTVGIRYSHESLRLPPAFVSRAITRGAAAIARGKASELRLGNREARRYVAFAGDYARSMRLALRYPTPGEFVVGTAESRPVRERCELDFARVGHDRRDQVVAAPVLWRPHPPVSLVGDASEARERLGRAPSLTIPQFVALMADVDPADGA